MFWKGKVSIFKHIETFLKKSDVSLVSLELPSLNKTGNCEISVSKPNDAQGIAKLLNEWFEDPTSKTMASVTPEWICSTYLEKQAIWIVAKDIRGTIRGCIACFRMKPPFPSQLEIQWGLIDWYCVHPLWRSKGVGSALLETIDFISYTVGRKALTFLKEGIPLPLPHIPIYMTWLQCRKAGSSKIKQVVEDSGLIVTPYHEVERATGIPMVKLEGLSNGTGLREWEEALDTVLPECWVFVSGDCVIDYKKGWKTDSLISMYAFRWSPGKWLGCQPSIVY